MGFWKHCFVITSLFINNPKHSSQQKSKIRHVSLDEENKLYPNANHKSPTCKISEGAVLSMSLIKMLEYPSQNRTLLDTTDHLNIKLFTTNLNVINQPIHYALNGLWIWSDLCLDMSGYIIRSMSLDFRDTYMYAYLFIYTDIYNINTVVFMCICRFTCTWTHARACEILCFLLTNTPKCYDTFWNLSQDFSSEQCHTEEERCTGRNTMYSNGGEECDSKKC